MRTLVVTPEILSFVTFDVVMIPDFKMASSQSFASNSKNELSKTDTP